MPGATPSQLVLASGKDSNAYLVDRNNLGGITAPVAQLSVGLAIGETSADTYRTSQRNLFCFSSRSNQVEAYKITPTNPPTIVSAWSVNQNGQGSPWVTTTDGTNNAIVWVVGAQAMRAIRLQWRHRRSDLRGGSELMTGTRQWNSGIARSWEHLLRCTTTRFMLSGSGGHAYAYTYG